MATNGKSNGAPAVNGSAYPIEDHSYDVVAVSYTHLDVYKRQTLLRRLRASSKATRPMRSIS